MLVNFKRIKIPGRRLSDVLTDMSYLALKNEPRYMSYEEWLIACTYLTVLNKIICYYRFYFFRYLCAVKYGVNLETRQ